MQMGAFSAAAFHSFSVSSSAPSWMASSILNTSASRASHGLRKGMPRKASPSMAANLNVWFMVSGSTPFVDE